MRTRSTQTRLGFTEHVTLEDHGRKVYTWCALGKLGAIALAVREVPVIDALGNHRDTGYKMPDGTPVYATDLGRHTAQPVMEWDESPFTDGCTYLEGVPCYYDGSGLQAEFVFTKWMTSGYDSAILEMLLTDYYRSWILLEE